MGASSQATNGRSPLHAFCCYWLIDTFEDYFTQRYKALPFSLEWRHPCDRPSPLKVLT